MEPFEWGPHFITGQPTVDKQHQFLVDLVNQFGKKIADDNLESEEIAPIFETLTSYAVEHFEDEQNIMLSNNIDMRHMDSHVQQHRTFLQEIENLQAHADKGENVDPKMIYDFLLHWLTYHILGQDQNMARQLSAIEQGSSPSEAFLAGEKKIADATEPLLKALKGLFTIVNQKNRELTELNQNLEKIVEERTSELLKANERLESIALTDVLTKLPNRRYAMRQLNQFWSEATKNNLPLSCMMIDADGFKAINDTYGHDAGDKVLQELARELKHSVRTDDVVCRLGGDEFLIICPETDLEGALFVAEKTKNKIASLTVKAGDGNWHGSISVGVAVNATEISTLDIFLKTADKSVYLAKDAGKNCVRSIQKESPLDSSN